MCDLWASQSTYNKTRSREILTTLNRIGVSTSYNEVRRSRKLMCQYTFKCSQINGTPLPSHLSPSGWCTGALDNEDFDDTLSLSGTESKHYTAQVLFQDASQPALSKPLVS